MKRRLLVAFVTGAAFAASFSGSALADASFGAGVASCAQATLGQRDNPPTITCSCDGATLTFADFGAMVAHMRTQG